MADDYGSMQTRIEDEIEGGGTALQSQIQLAILSAIKHYSKERWYFTETSTTFSTVAGTQEYNLPSDFKGMQRVRLTYTSGTFWEIDYHDFDYVNSITTINTVKGPPQIYAIWGQQLILYPIPDQVYTVTEYYEQQLTALSNSSDTNAWMVDGEELIRNRAKWDIYSSVIHEASEAAVCKALEQEAYIQLRSSNTQRTVQGRIRGNYL